MKDYNIEVNEIENGIELRFHKLYIPMTKKELKTMRDKFKKIKFWQKAMYSLPLLGLPFLIFTKKPENWLLPLVYGQNRLFLLTMYQVIAAIVALFLCLGRYL